MRNGGGVHIPPLYPFSSTPHKEAPALCTPQPPRQRPRAYLSSPSPTDVAQQMDFSALSQSGAAQFCSGTLHFAFSRLGIYVGNCQTVGEDTRVSDSDTASTVSWAASSGGFSTDVSDSRSGGSLRDEIFFFFAKDSP